MPKEFVVTGSVTFRGATCIVEAETEEEARLKVSGGDVGGGWDTDCAEMVDWSVDRVAENR
jgi:hypothetical protein